jgi:4-hydroxythreonine-4-phosphate dehydrogenase
MSKPIALAVSIGCPAGIGPEVAVSAAAKLTAELRCVLVGDAAVIARAARARRVARSRLVAVSNAQDLSRLGSREIAVWAKSTPLDPPVDPGMPHRWAGAAQLAWVNEATQLVRRRICAALVTAPVSKAVIADSGAPGAKRFRGHTEHLAEQLSAKEVVMAFHTDAFSTSLVTTHLPLRRVARSITPKRVAASCYWLMRMLGDLGVDEPRVVVASLNPHAGEAGLLGNEEQESIVPGMRLAKRRLGAARRRGRLSGPIGAETAYRRAAAGDFDGVVAMYHDQATIACKLLGFGEAVNVSLGLPIVRTSVDHGTAYDLAGSGAASDLSMREALLLARRLAQVSKR